jgi:hypothetical protein
MKAAQDVVLELWRGEEAHVDEGHPLGGTEYVLRRADGAVKSAVFPWSQELHDDLRAIHGGPGGARAEARERVGRALRKFLVALGWEGVETELLRALEADAQAEARVTVRCKAAELCRLPLELVKLEPANVALGQKDRCHLQWEWPGMRTARRTPEAPPEGGRCSSPGPRPAAWWTRRNSSAPSSG